MIADKIAGQVNVLHLITLLKMLPQVAGK